MKITASKMITSLVVATLITTFVFIDCDSKILNINKAEAASMEMNQSTAGQITSKTMVKEGITNLLKTAEQLRQAAVSGDKAKIKEYGPKLEENWSKIEDDIKPQYPKAYEQIEKFLNPAVAATESKSIDKELILKLDNQLIQVLNDLSQNLTQMDQVKAGATQLLSITNDLKKAIDAGDEAKIKEIGPKLEENWSTFEDNVRLSNIEIYRIIEENLNPEVAGSQQVPINMQNLGQLNNNLAQTLSEMLHNIK